MSLQGMSLNRPRPQDAAPFRRAVVTGAAGRIGSQFARLLARRGVALFVTDIDKAPLLRLARETGAEAGVCDLLSEHSVAALTGQIFQAGDADLLINAGGAGYVRTLGMMRLTREFAQRTAAHPATVVNVAPGPASPSGANYGYAGSPVAFHRLSKGLATKLAGRLSLITLDSPELDTQVEDFVDQLLGSECTRAAQDSSARRSGSAV